MIGLWVSSPGGTGALLQHSPPTIDFQLRFQHRYAAEWCPFMNGAVLASHLAPPAYVASHMGVMGSEAPLG